jgi:hypothetical protein
MDKEDWTRLIAIIALIISASNVVYQKYQFEVMKDEFESGLDYLDIQNIEISRVYQSGGEKAVDISFYVTSREKTVVFKRLQLHYTKHIFNGDKWKDEQGWLAGNANYKYPIKVVPNENPQSLKFTHQLSSIEKECILDSYCNIRGYQINIFHDLDQSPEVSNDFSIYWG